MCVTCTKTMLLPFEATCPLKAQEQGAIVVPIRLVLGRTDLVVRPADPWEKKSEQPLPSRSIRAAPAEILADFFPKRPTRKADP